MTDYSVGEETLQGALAGLICQSFAFKVPAPDFALAIVKGLSRVAPRAPSACRRGLARPRSGGPPEFGSAA